MHHSLTVEEIKLLKKGDELKVLSSYCLTYASDNDIVIYINTRKYERNDFYSIQCMNKKGEIFSWSSRHFALLGKEDPLIENSKRSNGMLRIIGERGNGKTVAAVAVAKAFNAILVVPHRDMPPLDCDNSELLYSYPYVCAYNDIRKIVKRHFRENGLREINIVFDELPLCQFDDFLNYFVNKTRGVHIDLKLIAYTGTINKDF